MKLFRAVCYLSFCLSIYPGLAPALAKDKEQTTRTVQLETDDIQVWKTVIHPKQPLNFHRHNFKRLVVALTDVELTVTPEKGPSHKLNFKKGTTHLLEADKPGELHADINESDEPMEVIVIQFKK